MTSCQLTDEELRDVRHYVSSWSFEILSMRTPMAFDEVVVGPFSSATDRLAVARCSLLVPWASYQIRKIAGCACAGNAGNVFPRRRFQRKPIVSDPGMHHGTCVTHVPWCMSGSLTCGDGENVPGIPGACAPAILRIWQEAHGPTFVLGSTNSCFLFALFLATSCLWKGTPSTNINFHKQPKYYLNGTTKIKKKICWMLVLKLNVICAGTDTYEAGHVWHSVFSSVSPLIFRGD